MMPTRLAFTIMILFAAACPCWAGMTAGQLRCEYRDDPVGIDAAQPRLSWILQSDERGQRQTAYRVLVASSPELLANDQGDLWDTGRAESDESIQIPYKGGKLGPGQQCWWKIQAWDREGEASPWSKPATWTMGLLVPSGGDAKWIGIAPNQADSNAHPHQLPLLRREFELPKPVRRAMVSVCGLGQYELRLNGNKVGDYVLDPGWTNYKQSCLYSTFDVTDELRAGKNCLGVMLGNGMYHELGVRFWKFTGSFGPPKMILQMQIDFADGTTSRIITDPTWQTAMGPIVFSSIFGGEDYDARLEQPGWDQPDFDAARWSPALVVDGPGGELVAQSAPPVKVIESFGPKQVSEPLPGVFVYDLGQNFSGWPMVSLRGPAGATVKITPSEVLDAQGLVDQRGWGCPPGERKSLAYFVYTLKGRDKMGTGSKSARAHSEKVISGEVPVPMLSQPNGEGIETWHPQFSYYGFRYLQVEGATPEDKPADDRPVILKIEGQFTRSSSSRVGSFACSNELFNRVHQLVDWGVGSNLQSVLTDCPHREKLGWLEIAHLMGPSIMYNYDVAALYAKIARDTSESQLPNGMVPTTAPEYSMHPDNFRDSPEWGSAAVIIPWQLYGWYGDRRVLSDRYETMKRYVDYLSSKAQDHIIAYGLGDWGDFPNAKDHMGWAQLTPISLTDTAIYYYDATILAKVATILDKPDDARTYAVLADNVQNAFNRAFFNPETNWYASGTPIVPNELRNEWNQALFDLKTHQYTSPSQTSQALPLALGIVEPDHIEAVFANLVIETGKQEYVTAGDVGHRFLLRALANHGRSDIINKLHNRTTNPSYGFQLAQGLTALGEAWDGRSEASMNHCQMGHIVEWFHGDLLGIQCDPTAVAFKHIVIRPQIVGDLSWAQGSYDSIRGPIAVDWKIDGGQLILKTTIPTNTLAIVHVPTTDAANVLEGGKPAAEATGVTPAGTSDGVAQYQVESGSYIFTAPWK